MTDTYVYSIEQENPTTIYINLTNKCTNKCVFCIRNLENPMKGADLWLKNEDVAFEDVVSQLENFPNAKEAVFCGYGEPTIKLELLKQVSKYIKNKNPEMIIRINTNGQGNLINKKDITEELKGIVDEMSISLNAATNEAYMEISGCKNENAYDEVKNFIKLSVEKGFNTTATVVTGYKNYKVDVEKCKKITSDLGADFREREWLETY